MARKRKPTWEQEGISLGDIVNFSREMLSLAKGARDLGEAAGVSTSTVRDLATVLLDIEEGVQKKTGVDLTRRLQDYLGALIPQDPGKKPAAGEISEVNRRIDEINDKLTELHAAGWFRSSEKLPTIFRAWEKLVAAGYSLPREQFDRGREYYQLIDDFGERLSGLQPTEESVEVLASMVEPMVERAKELVNFYGRAGLPDTGFSSQVRGDPDYVRILLETVANRRPRYW
jgi:hypothetical protein